MSRYNMINLSGDRNREHGVSMIAITSLIGITTFLSMIASGLSPWFGFSTGGVLRR